MAHNKSLADLRLEISKIEDQLGDISQRTIINGGTAESTPKPRVERNDRVSGIGSAQRGGVILIQVRRTMKVLSLRNGVAHGRK